MKGKTSKFAIIIMIIVAMVVSAMIVFFIRYQTVDNYMTARCYSYLSEKYGADKSELTMLDHDKKHLYFNDAAIPELKWAPYKWEFEYKGRSFFVNRIDGKYYDDYQLEDIENWCTDWLQKNVDDRIISIEISTFSIIEYTKCKKNDLYIMSNNYNEIYGFINFMASISTNKYVFVDFIDTSIIGLEGIEKYIKTEEIEKEINNELVIFFEKNVCSVYEEENIQKFSFKFENSWHQIYQRNYYN